jgi:hypothetical protein
MFEKFWIGKGFNMRYVLEKKVESYAKRSAWGVAEGARLKVLG